MSGIEDDRGDPGAPFLLEEGEKAILCLVGEENRAVPFGECGLHRGTVIQVGYGAFQREGEYMGGCGDEAFRPRGIPIEMASYVTEE